jgi:hypothetical protein
VDHRRRPAHDLLDRGRRHTIEISRPHAPLVGMVAERLHAVADRVAGGLVAGHHEQHEERGELLVGERSPVDLGVQKLRGEIVLRLAPALGGELVHELGERLARGERSDERIRAGRRTPDR